MDGEMDSDAVFCSDLMKLLDERLAVFKKRDLPGHLAILNNWEGKLNEIEEWYKSSGDEFKKFTDKIKEQHVEAQKNKPLALLFHDHSYCLKAYRKPVQVLVPHECGPKCRDAAKTPSELVTISPLEIPLRCGWQREIVQRCEDHTSRDAYYITPCGRRLRSMDEVKCYLDMTRTSNLSGIHFTFDPLCTLACPSYNPMAEKALIYIRDVSNGKERVPVSCVNTFNNDRPDCVLDGFEYLTTRTFDTSIEHVAKPESLASETGGDHMTESSSHVTDPDGHVTKSGRHGAEPGFLVCCSCSDNCSNRSKCECWQLTLEEAKVIGNSRYSVGYVHQRLKRPQHSAVYECNSHCKCGRNCSNYVVKRGVVHRLQLFHTGNPQLKWGLRTLDDIPMGTFVCSYVGHVYTEMSAEMKALQHGDEYFADLDYIEVMEYHKEGYEPEVIVSDDSSILSCEANDKSLLSFTTTPQGGRDSLETTPTLSRHPSSETPSRESMDDPVGVDDVELESSHSRQAPPTLETTPSTPRYGSPISVCASHSPFPTLLPHPSSKHSKTRRFFGENFNYIIDAKSHGNMARYINHSCDPNLFVQNVFVDTHDLRFPWVAFFSKRRIKAMEELTWDYNYDIGSVPNKEIPCLCGSQNCRRRLL